MEKQTKSWTTMKVYLLVASLAGLFGTLVGLGAVISQFASYRIISEDEFVNSRYRDLQQCESAIPNEKGETKPRTTTEIETCKKDSKERIVKTRKFELKNAAVNGTLRGLLFLIIFITHYPKFVRYNKE